MEKSYLTNPITDELIREGILTVIEKVSVKDEYDRIVTSKETGETCEEKIIEIRLRYKDPRSFNKSFPDAYTIFLKLFEGNTRAQMPFILLAAIEKSINKDFVHLSYKDVKKICEEREIQVWTRDKLSKCISWFLKNNILFKIQDEPGKYFFNTKMFYNGMFARQLGLIKGN